MQDLHNLKVGHLPPLMGENELPLFLLKNDAEMEKLTGDPDDDREFGRGSRTHKDVDYSDGMTEKQWLKMVDEGDLEALEEAKTSRKRKARSVSAPVLFNPFFPFYVVVVSSDEETIILPSQTMKNLSTRIFEVEISVVLGWCDW